MDKVESLLPLLDQANYAKDMRVSVLCLPVLLNSNSSNIIISYDDFYDPLRSLLLSLSSSSSARPTPTSLLSSFNDPETSNSVVVFLRLLTSAYLKANADDFAPFLFGLEDDPRFFESGTPTLDEFCSFYVEVRLIPSLLTSVTTTALS